MIDGYIEQYGKRLYGLCLTLCRNSFDADDLYQETWLKAYKKFEQYDKSRPFEGWLTGICVNTYRDILRKRRRSNIYDNFSTEEEKEAVLEKTATAEPEDMEHIRAAVDELPEKLRVTVILYYFYQLNMSQVSASLKIPVGTVKSRLNKARNMLKEVLKNEADI